MGTQGVRAGNKSKAAELLSIKALDARGPDQRSSTCGHAWRPAISARLTETAARRRRDLARAGAGRTRHWPKSPHSGRIVRRPDLASRLLIPGSHDSDETGGFPDLALPPMRVRVAGPDARGVSEEGSEEVCSKGSTLVTPARRHRLAETGDASSAACGTRVVGPWRGRGHASWSDAEVPGCTSSPVDDTLALMPLRGDRDRAPRRAPKRRAWRAAARGSCLLAGARRSRKGSSASTATPRAVVEGCAQKLVPSSGFLS